jgi:hypothetical protein
MSLGVVTWFTIAAWLLEWSSETLCQPAGLCVSAVVAG